MFIPSVENDVDMCCICFRRRLKSLIQPEIVSILGKMYRFQLFGIMPLESVLIRYLWWLVGFLVPSQIMSTSLKSLCTVSFSLHAELISRSKNLNNGSLMLSLVLVNLFSFFNQIISRSIFVLIQKFIQENNIVKKK